MPYNLPPAVDVFWRNYVDTTLPAATSGVKGKPFLQFNAERVFLSMHNQVAATTIYLSDQEFGPNGDPTMGMTLDANDRWVTLDFPPRNQIFAWRTGAAELHYVEGIMQPFRGSVGKGIRSNVQH